MLKFWHTQFLVLSENSSSASNSRGCLLPVKLVPLHEVLVGMYVAITVTTFDFMPKGENKFNA